MFCSKCGKENGENDAFCAQCGTSTSKPQTLSTISYASTQKIGGWLYVVALGLFVTPFLLAYGVFDSLSLIFDGTIVYVNEEIPGMSLLIWFEIVLDLVMALIIAYIIFLFVNKRHEFPKYYIWYLIASLVYLLADYAMAASLTTANPEMKVVLEETLTEQISDIISAIIGSIIWVLYMKKSKRVATTFVK